MLEIARRIRYAYTVTCLWIAYFFGHFLAFGFSAFAFVRIFGVSSFPLIFFSIPPHFLHFFCLRTVVTTEIFFILT